MISKLTPEKVFLAAWGLQFLIVVMGVLGADRYELSFLTVAVCCVGVFSVLAGCVLGRATKLPLGKVRDPRPQGIKAVIWVLFLFGAIGAVLTARQWMSLGVNPFGGASLYEMNLIYSAENEAFGGLSGRLYAVLPVLLLVVVYSMQKKLISRRVGIVACVVVVALMISPRRSALITSLLAAAFLLSLGKLLPLRSMLAKVVPVVLLIFLFFSYTQYKLQKIEDFSFSSALDVVTFYVGSSVYVMDGLIETPHFDNTYIILNLPARAVNAVFDQDLDVDLSVPFVSDPVVSNTVPIFYYFYKSSGFIGVILLSAAIGWFSAVSYRYAESTGSLAASIVASLAMAALALSIRENVFFSYDFIWRCFVGFLCNFFVTRRIKL